jgi:hypothetical protein
MAAVPRGTAPEPVDLDDAEVAIACSTGRWVVDNRLIELKAGDPVHGWATIKRFRECGIPLRVAKAGETREPEPWQVWSPPAAPPSPAPAPVALVALPDPAACDPTLVRRLMATARDTAGEAARRGVPGRTIELLLLGGQRQIVAAGEDRHLAARIAVAVQHELARLANDENPAARRYLGEQAIACAAAGAVPAFDPRRWLASLAQRGISVAAQEGKLAIQPGGALNQVDRTIIERHRAAILDAVSTVEIV